MLHQIGVGALGPVFRTYEPERDRLVAVKVFRLDITPEQAQQLADELARSAEAGLFHPSVVEPIAAGVQGTVAYAAEEYVAAESLDAAMRHYAPAPIGTVLPFITQLAGAIDFARAAGVGHGALHPRDIFVTPEEARATGFGVVEALERVGLRAPVRRPYSPPERIASQSWNTSADVFSLAAITFELLTGRRPAGIGAEIGTLTVGTPNSWMDGIHAVLARAMDPDPSARYSTALGFASALESAGRGEPVTGPSSSISSAASAPLISGLMDERPAGPADNVRTGGPANPLTSAPAVESDIEAERDDDEVDHRLRAEEAAVAAATPELFTDLEGDIAAEAEADRFAADDFLLDAAGAASAAPPGERRAFEFEDEEEVAAAPAPSMFASRDLQDDTRVDLQPAIVPPPSSLGYSSMADEPANESRSLWPVALLVLLALAAGAGGGWFLRGRVAPESSAGTGSAATAGSTAATPATPGREFSEQAVAPPAQTPAPPASTAPAAPATANRSTAAPVARPPARPAEAAPKPPATGTLIVRSTPAGAGVTLNGKWRGRTPLTIEDLALTRYDIRVVQQGFEPAAQTVSLTDDTPERSLSLRLERLPRAAAAARPAPAPAPSRQQDSIITSNYTGSVYVDSRPRGAKVSIDGREVGVTPLRVPDVRIGSHVVRLELPDHRIWSSTATVAAGQESRVTGSLERIQ